MSSFRKLWAKPRQCLSCPLLFFPPSSFAGKLEKGKKGGGEEEEGGQSSYTRKASIVLVLWSVCARSVEGRTDLPSPFFLGKKIYILLLRCGVVGCGKGRVGRCVTFLWGYRTLSILLPLPLPFFISVEGGREKSFSGRAPA